MTDRPYEETLSIDELRREVRWLWDRETAFWKALRDIPEIPPVTVLHFLSSARRDGDSDKGKELQRKHGLDAIPPRHEYEIGAGVWWRIRRNEQLETALKAARDAINDKDGLNSHAICDTVWHSPIETLVDYIDAQLQGPV